MPEYCVSELKSIDMAFEILRDLDEMETNDETNEAIQETRLRIQKLEREMADKYHKVILFFGDEEI